MQWLLNLCQVTFHSWQLFARGGRQVFYFNNMSGNTTHPELIHSPSSGENNAMDRNQSPTPHLSNGGSGGGGLAAHWPLGKSQTILPREGLITNPKSSSPSLPEVKAKQLWKLLWTLTRSPWVILWGITHDVPLKSYVEAPPHSLLVLALMPEVKILANEPVYSCEHVHECIGETKMNDETLSQGHWFWRTYLVWSD